MYRQTRNGEKIKVNIIQRTTSETIRLGKPDERPRTLLSKPEMASNVPQHNETPSYSEDTYSRDTDELQSCYAGTVSSSSPCYTTSSQHGVTVVPSGQPAVTVTAAVGQAQAPAATVTRPPVTAVSAPTTTQTTTVTTVSATPSVTNAPAVSEAAKPPVTTSTRILGDRFKVVKIESIVPFYRGRWKCIDYLDHSIHTPKDAYVYCDDQYVKASNVKAKYTQAKQNTTTVVGQARTVPAATLSSPVTITQPQPIFSPFMTSQNATFQNNMLPCNMISPMSNFSNQGSNISANMMMNQVSSMPTYANPTMYMNQALGNMVSQASNTYANPGIMNQSFNTSIPMYMNQTSSNMASPVSNYSSSNMMLNQISSMPSASITTQAINAPVSMYMSAPTSTFVNQAGNMNSSQMSNMPNQPMMMNQVSNISAPNQGSNMMVNQASNFPTNTVSSNIANMTISNICTMVCQASSIATSVIMSQASNITQASNMIYQRQLSAPVSSYAAPAMTEARSMTTETAFKAFTAYEARTVQYCQSPASANIEQPRIVSSTPNYVQTSNVYNAPMSSYGTSTPALRNQSQLHEEPRRSTSAYCAPGQFSPNVSVPGASSVSSGQVYSVTTQSFSATVSYASGNTSRQTFSTSSYPGLGLAQVSRHYDASLPSSPVDLHSNLPVQHVHHHYPVSQTIFTNNDGTFGSTISDQPQPATIPSRTSTYIGCGSGDATNPCVNCSHPLQPIQISMHYNTPIYMSAPLTHVPTTNNVPTDVRERTTDPAASVPLNVSSTSTVDSSRNLNQDSSIHVLQHRAHVNTQPSSCSITQFPIEYSTSNRSVTVLPQQNQQQTIMPQQNQQQNIISQQNRQQNVMPQQNQQQNVMPQQNQQQNFMPQQNQQQNVIPQQIRQQNLMMQQPQQQNVVSQQQNVMPQQPQQQNVMSQQPQQQPRQQNVVSQQQNIMPQQPQQQNVMSQQPQQQPQQQNVVLQQPQQQNAALRQQNLMQQPQQQNIVQQQQPQQQNVMLQKPQLQNTMPQQPQQQNLMSQQPQQQLQQQNVVLQQTQQQNAAPRQIQQQNVMSQQPLSQQPLRQQNLMQQPQQQNIVQQQPQQQNAIQQTQQQYAMPQQQQQSQQTQQQNQVPRQPQQQTQQQNVVQQQPQQQNVNQPQQISPSQEMHRAEVHVQPVNQPNSSAATMTATVAPSVVTSTAIASPVTGSAPQPRIAALTTTGIASNSAAPPVGASGSAVPCTTVPTAAVAPITALSVALPSATSPPVAAGGTGDAQDGVPFSGQMMPTSSQ